MLTGIGEMDWWGLLYSAVFTIAILFLGIIIFNRQERTFMDTIWQFVFYPCVVIRFCKLVACEEISHNLSNLHRHSHSDMVLVFFHTAIYRSRQRHRLRQGRPFWYVRFPRQCHSVGATKKHSQHRLFYATANPHVGGDWDTSGDLHRRTTQWRDMGFRLQLAWCNHCLVCLPSVL